MSDSSSRSRKITRNLNVARLTQNQLEIGQRCVNQGFSAVLIAELLQKPVSQVKARLGFPREDPLKKPEGHSPLLFRDWRCDACSQPIAGSLTAWVCWHDDADLMEKSKSKFEIVHDECLGDPIGFMRLSDLVGHRGLSYFLGMLSAGRIEKLRGRPDNCEVEDLEGFVDLLRRLFVPNYEAARQHFSNRKIEDKIGKNTTRYSPEDLQAIIELGNSSQE